MNTTRIRSLGLMCGTSHDGLDAAVVDFEFERDAVKFKVFATESFGLDANIRDGLGRATHMSALELIQLDRLFCHFTVDRLQQSSLMDSVEVIGFHGPTVFHQPENNISLQLGSGAVINALLNTPVVCDFRQQDISKGGQGAPLIPSADALLFNTYDYTLNLGGFCNLSDLSSMPNVSGFDIAPCNLLLNHLSRMEGHPFDEGGRRASHGNCIESWYQQLNALEFHQLPPPKSLGYEWFEKNVLPTIPLEHPVKDLLHTACEYIATQIAHQLSNNGKVLVTGGGAWNDHLLRRIRDQKSLDLVRPEPELVDHRESIAFALFAALRWLNKTNVLATVTGSKHDSIAGALYTT